MTTPPHPLSLVRDPLPAAALERIVTRVQTAARPVPPPEFHFDSEKFRQSLAAIADRIAHMVAGVQRGLNGMSRVLRATANTPENVAGVVATYQVRAGLDPTLDEDGLHRLVADILAGGPDDTFWLTRPHRAAVAAAALRAWVVHRQPDHPHLDLRFGPVRCEVRPIHRYELTGPAAS